MIRVLRILGALWILIILQTTLVPAVTIGFARPDLPLILVLLVALHEGAAGGALAGFLAGLFVDTESARTLGTSSLVSSLVGYATGRIATHVERTSTVTRMVLAFVAAVVKSQMEILLAGPGEIGGIRAFFSVSLPSGLATALLAPLVMVVVEWVVGWSREMSRGRR